MARSLLWVPVLVSLLTTASAQTGFVRERKPNAIEGEREAAAKEAFEHRAFPAADITSTQLVDAFLAFQSVQKRPGGKKTNWQPVGPTHPVVPAENVYTGRQTMFSGRVTAVAIAPTCSGSNCKIFIGAAGGGLWEADNAMAHQLNWRPSGDGIPTNSIGTIVFDPNDPKGRTIYVGTGERSQSAGAHVGVGLYKSTDFGRSWTRLESTFVVAAGRSITSLLIETGNPQHLVMGTDVAFAGMSATGPTVWLPPDRPPVGVYESFDGGQAWNAHMVNIGAGELAFDPKDPTTVYVATNWRGLWRRSRRLEGNDLFHLVLGVATFDRASMAVTLKDGKTRVYAAHGGATSLPSEALKRVDDADITAAQLRTAWTTLTSPVKGNPGYTSYAFCTPQCWFDIFVASPPGQPDTVWLGGAMTYNDIFSATPPSNGRTVLRSTDAGVTFSDLTRDAQTPPEGMHPDQHAIAFAPFNPDVAFIGSDGGVARTSGAFVDQSGDCVSRGLAGSDLVNCQRWLSAVPTQNRNLNRGLATLQFQSVSVNPHDPLNDLIGGTQDNGTWAYDGRGHGTWFNTDWGDGGESGIDAANPNVRAHIYFRQFGAINFRGTDPLGWNGWYDPLLDAREPVLFYPPLIADPRVSASWFIGMARVWRTQDNGGPDVKADNHCNFNTPPAPPHIVCGDWVPLGSSPLSGPAYGTTKPFGSVAAIRRAPGDDATMWTATTRGRVFLTRNANEPNNLAVTFERVDTAAQPNRFVSGIAVDPARPARAFVSFSGFAGNTPGAPGHVYEVVHANGSATWRDLSYDLGDLPITGIAYDDVTGDLFASTDYGVALLPAGTASWRPAAGSLPPAAVYGLTIHSGARVLYAATHGRGIWRLNLSK